MLVMLEYRLPTVLQVGYSPESGYCYPQILAKYSTHLTPATGVYVTGNCSQKSTGIWPGGGVV